MRARGGVRASLVALILVSITAGTSSAEPAPVVSAKAIVVMDGWTGDVLYEKNADEPRALASLTKIMSGLVILDHARLGDVVTISKRAATTGEASCDLKEGERLTVGQLLDMALIRSANDAVVALAEHVGGSVEGFVDLMNRKAAALALQRSHFTNPHGLDADGHHESARDLAQLARLGLQNATFAGIVRTKEKTIARAGQKDGYKIQSTNQLLGVRPDCIGVKTGWTNKAGYCLVAAAQRGARRFIVVLMASGDRFAEAGKLLDWAFRSYEERVVLAGGAPVAWAPLSSAELSGVYAAPRATLVTSLAVGAPAPAVRFTQSVAEAPVYAGQVIGSFEIVRGKQVTRVPAVAVRTVRRSFLAAALAWPSNAAFGVCLGCGLVGSLLLRRGAGSPARAGRRRVANSHTRRAGAPRLRDAPPRAAR